MNGDTNKHKPLSREELFRLLETKDEHALPGADLDDFEKDALEGFSKHSSVEKARELTNEIDVLIHEKVNEKKTSRPVPRVAWFSAAASILLLVILSFYFLAETAGPGKPEIALNENNSSNSIPGKETKPVTLPQEESDAGIRKEPVKKETMSDELQQQIVTLETKNMLKGSAGVSAMDKDKVSAEKFKGDAIDHNRATNTTSGYSGTETDVTKSADKKASDELNNTDHEKSKVSPAPSSEDLKQSTAANGAVIVNKTPVQQKDDQSAPVTIAEKRAKEQEAITYAAPKSNNTETKQPSSKQRKKQAEADKSVVVAGTTAAKEEEKSPLGSANNVAYYAGGEEAIKTYVIKWLKKQQYKENELQGTYKARIKILANGTVNVMAVEPEKSGYTDMAEPVKKALNSMDGWKPALINGSASESEMVIHLAF